MIPQEIINIERILSEFLGESKNGISDSGQVQYGCPKCIEEKGHNEATKHNLEVNLFKLVYQCWSCSSIDDSMKGPLSKLIKQYGNNSLYQRYKEEVKSLKSSLLYDFDLYSGVTFETKEEEYIRLPKTFKKINLNCCPKQVQNYCFKRKIDQDIINKFNIGYTSWENEDIQWRNRIIVPSYNSFGELNYFVGRDFSDKNKMKYRNCDSDKKAIVCQESHINTDSDIILVEGALDCIYSPNTIPLLGKVLTKDNEIFNFLYKNANGRIIICLDSDTDINETKKIYSLLNFGRLYNKIYYIRLNEYKDFGELYENKGKKGIIEAIHNCKQFTPIELIF